MAPLIILAAIALVPFVVTFLFRADGAIVFLSVALGTVLATYVAGDTADVLTAASSGNNLAAMQWVQIALLVLPVVLALLLTRKKTRGLKHLLSSVTALAAGAMLALLLVPYLSGPLQTQMKDTFLWREIDNLETALIIAGTLLVFLQLFMNRFKPEKGKKKH